MIPNMVGEAVVAWSVVQALPAVPSPPIADGGPAPPIG